MHRSHSECAGAAEGGAAVFVTINCGGSAATGIAVRLLFQPLPALCNLRVRQITGISSSSQELSPRRKIRRGLFESDDTLSGHTLPSAQKVAAAANR